MRVNAFDWHYKVNSRGESSRGALDCSPAHSLGMPQSTRVRLQDCRHAVTTHEYGAWASDNSRTLSVHCTDCGATAEAIEHRSPGWDDLGLAFGDGLGVTRADRS